MRKTTCSRCPEPAVIHMEFCVRTDGHYDENKYFCAACWEQYRREGTPDTEERESAK